MSDLISVDKLKPLEIFTESGVDPILHSIVEKVNNFKPDLSTIGSRKEIASMANKVARSKTLLDGLGKDLVSEWKTKAKVVDASRKKIRESLDKLKEEVRRPLSDWEDKEARRLTQHRATINSIKELCLFDFDYDSTQLKSNLGTIEAISIGPHLEEFELEAKATKLESLAMLNKKILEVEAREAEKAELDRLRLAEEEREENDRLQKIKDKAAILAKKEAEEIAEKARKKAEVEAAKKIEEQERLRLKAISDKEDAEKRVVEAELREKDAVEMAEKNRINAENQARKNEELARIKERERIELENKRKDDEEKKRAADLEHRKLINNNAANALCSNVETISKDQARELVIAISKGFIPSVTLRY